MRESVFVCEYLFTYKSAFIGFESSTLLRHQVPKVNKQENNTKIIAGYSFSGQTLSQHFDYRFSGGRERAEIRVSQHGLIPFSYFVGHFL